jgi:hypothetical protein
MYSTGFFVCWHCRRGNVGLHRVKNSFGQKTNNYVCADCLPNFPTPPVENISFIKYPTKEELASSPEVEGSETVS